MSGSNDEIANTGGPASSAEPSMEEILASIRRILKDDQAPESAEPEDEILVLDSTMVVKPGNSIAPELSPAEPEPAQPAYEPEPAAIEAVPAPGPMAEFPQPDPMIEAPSTAPEYAAEPHLSSELPALPTSDFDMPLAETPVPAAMQPEPAQPEHPEPASFATQAEPDAFEPMEEPNMADDNHENIQPPPGLVSESAREAAAGSIGALIRTISSDRSVAVGRPGLTLEDLVREELRPLLKSWLDSNLPPLVERIVRAEIQRVIERSAV